MFQVSDSTPVGYALLDAELRVIRCSEQYLRIVRMARSDVKGHRFQEIFPETEMISRLMEAVRTDGLLVQARSYPYVFRHWDEWEEKSYDFQMQLLGEPGAADALVLVRLSETALATAEDEPSVTSLLRHKHGRVPLFSGEDMEGRTIDVYVHPAAHARERLVLLAVYRDGRQSTTYEFPSSAVGRLALATALHVKP